MKLSPPPSPRRYDERAQVALVLAASSPPGAAAAVEQWEGRHMIALPEARVRAVVARVRADAPELIVHELLELEEALGVLLIFIVKDPNGFELCLASSETFDPAVRAAADWKPPDFARRTALAIEYAEAAAAAAAEDPLVA